MSGSAGQFKFCFRYSAFSRDKGGIGPDLSVLPKDAIFASSTGMNILKFVSETCPRSIDGFTQT